MSTSFENGVNIRSVCIGNNIINSSNSITGQGFFFFFLVSQGPK